MRDGSTGRKGDEICTSEVEGKKSGSVEVLGQRDWECVLLWCAAEQVLFLRAEKGAKNAP